MDFVGFFYLLKPTLGIQSGFEVAGVDVLDMLLIAASLLALFFWLLRQISGRALPLQAVDLLIILYACWCFVVTVAYPEYSNFQDTIKFVMPPLTYVVFRELLESRKAYWWGVFFMLLGFSVPAFVSLYQNFTGSGLSKINYWTGLGRYRGAYTNPHDYGHSMAFCLMLGAVLYAFSDFRKSGFAKRGFVVVWAAVMSVATIGLYMSFVRTAWLGILFFCVVWGGLVGRRAFLALGLVLGLVFISAIPLISLVFHDVVEVAEGDRDAERIGSGRPFIWSHNLEIFEGLSFDRQLAGVGLGNRVEVLTEHSGNENVWNSHNDFLEVLMQTGAVGLTLFLAINILLANKIFRLRDKRERHVILALFLSVMFMNFLSNSYVARASVGQMFYLVMAYLGSRGAALNRQGRNLK